MSRPVESKPEAKKRLLNRLIFKPTKRTKRYFVLAANALILFAISAFIIMTSSERNLANKQASLNSNLDGVGVIDELSSVDVAVTVARLTNLEEEVAVTNQADTINAQLSVSSTDDKIVAKPQVIDPNVKTKKDIIIYTVQSGDSVNSVAEKFGVSANTIRWSNGIAGNSLQVGKELLISPINGIVYTVASGDTPESISRKFNVDKNLLIGFNDAEISGFKVGDRIVVPNGTQPAPALRSYSWANFRATYGYNGYVYGYCTWWAATRRAQTGRPIPANLGNACTWRSLASAAGIPTGPTPRDGAVLWHKSGCLGHVGFVERVNSDGSFWVSDMNYQGYTAMDTSAPRTGGWSRVSYRLESAASAGNYYFIY